jgi:hypothetical protein
VSHAFHTPPAHGYPHQESRNIHTPGSDKNNLLSESSSLAHLAPCAAARLSVFHAWILSACPCPRNKIDNRLRTWVAGRLVFEPAALFASFPQDAEASICADDDRVLTEEPGWPGKPRYSALTGCLSFSLKLSACDFTIPCYANS